MSLTLREPSRPDPNVHGLEADSLYPPPFRATTRGLTLQFPDIVKPLPEARGAAPQMQLPRTRFRDPTGLAPGPNALCTTTLPLRAMTFCSTRFPREAVFVSPPK